MNLHRRSFLNLTDFTPAEITGLLDLAAEKAACTWFRQTNGIKYRFHTSINRQKDSLCA